MYKYIKRGMDIVLSGLAIVCSSPFWIATIIGIEVSDPGPIFYKANRIGKDNKEFSNKAKELFKEEDISPARLSEATPEQLKKIKNELDKSSNPYLPFINLWILLIKFIFVLIISSSIHQY